MFKNAIISLLLSTILFMTEPYTGMFDIFVFLSVVVVTYALVCVVEDAWDRHMDKVRRFKRFKREVQKNISTLPTKAIS